MALIANALPTRVLRHVFVSTRTMRLASMVGSGVTPADILCRRNLLQMGRIHAAPVSAEVIELLPIFDRANLKLVRSSVRHFLFSVQPDAAVSVV